MADDGHIAPVVRLQVVERVPIRRKGSKRPTCRHGHIVVDFEQRTIECDDCKQVIDPFAYLELLATGWEHYANWRHAELQAQKRVIALQDEEKRTKARLRRARAKEARCRT